MGEVIVKERVAMGSQPDGVGGSQCRDQPRFILFQSLLPFHDASSRSQQHRNIPRPPQQNRFTR